MNIVKMTLVFDGHHGQYTSQVFAESFPEWFDDINDLQDLLMGPESDFYWETWNNVLCSEHMDQFLTIGEGGSDLFICAPSPLDPIIRTLAEGEGLKDGPSEIRELVEKLANEFITDGDEWISEEEALLYFAPSQYNTPDVNKACKWIQAQLKEAIQ